MSTDVREIKKGHYYRFGNKATSKTLNHYAPSGSNVNVYTEDGSKDQIWKYETDGRLYPESNPTMCLDRYIGSSNYNNADVYAPNDPDNQIIEFVKIGTTNDGFYYYIKVNEHYLTQVGNDAHWTETADGDNSKWLTEELIKVTNIPDGSSDNTVDYFSVWSGFTNGVFNESTSITNLYRACFGSAGSDSVKYYNMYGAVFSGSDTSLRGKFHTGIDFNPGEGANVYAPISGTVVYSSSHYGTVTVKETGTNRLFLFLHMTNRISENSTVTAGQTVLGKVSGVGASGAQQFSPHLHVEVHPANGTTSGNSYQINSFNNRGDSIPVHDYF
jgi:murein DD-endopeptidase MepM/ murein hydrolase activator NlpD